MSIDSFGHDLKSALRALQKSPGFVAVALASLALGIGLATAAFSFLDGLRFRALPFPDADRLVAFGEMDSTRTWCGGCPSSLAAYRQWPTSLESVDRVVARMFTGPARITIGDQHVNASGAAVSASSLQLFGARPIVGRLFTAQDDEPGSAPTVIIGTRLWNNVFGGRADVVGQVLTVVPYATAEHKLVIVGVVPSGATFSTRDEDFWTPLEPELVLPGRTRAIYGSAGFLDVELFGRLAAGATPTRLRAELLSNRVPYTGGPRRTEAFVIPLRELLLRSFGYDILLGSIATVVLLIACTNLANLQVVRAFARHREIAIRSALGAEPGRLVRQLLLENVILAVAGGILALVVAIVLIRMLPAESMGRGWPGWARFGIDTRTVVFALIVVGLTGVAVGWPLARIGRRTDLGRIMRESATNVPVGSKRVGQRILVSIEIAAAVVLLASSATVGRAYYRSVHFDPQFDVDRVMTIHVRDRTRWTTPFMDRAALRLRSVPGVAAVTTTGFTSLGFNRHTMVDDGPGTPTRSLMRTRYLRAHYVDSSYLSVIGVRMVRGRFFGTADAAGVPPSIIVSETFASRLWPGAPNVVGRRLKFGVETDTTPWFTVVGVIANSLPEDDVSYDERDPYPSRAIMPIAQMPKRELWMLEVRTAAIPQAGVLDAIRGAIRDETGAALADIVTFTARQSLETIARPMKRNAAMIGAVAIGGLVLAVIGIYGVVAYGVRNRTPEIGIRIALGATRPSVLGLVLRDASIMAIAGLAAGIVAAAASSKILSTVIYGSKTAPPMVFVFVSIGFLVVALVASVIPAQRALRIDPVRALRG